MNYKEELEDELELLLEEEQQEIKIKGIACDKKISFYED